MKFLFETKFNRIDICVGAFMGALSATNHILWAIILILVGEAISVVGEAIYGDALHRLPQPPK